MRAAITARAQPGRIGGQHDRAEKADDADRERQRAGVGQAGQHGADPRGAPVRRRHHQLKEVAQADRAHEAADDQLDRPVAAALEQQDAIGHDRGHGHAPQQRHAEQQRQPDGAAQELGQVRRHGRHLARRPHRPHRGPGKMVAA